MSLAILTLPTNKSISTVSDYVRKIGQGEAGQKLEVIVTDVDGSGYNLDGKTLEFSENKEGGKIVSDNDHDHFEIKDAKAGRFVYTLAPAVYAASGVAWFDITSADGSVIDTTKNFNIDVIEDESIHINNDNYVSSLASFETHYDGVIKKAKEDSEALLTKIDGQLSQALADNNKKAADSLTDQKAQLQKLIDSTNQLQTDWNAQFTKQKQSLSDVDASWQTQEKAINDAANKQLADLKTSNQADITAAVKSINDQRDAALKQLNDDKTKELAGIQSDYNSWKASTVKDFNDTVQPIKEGISENDQKLTTVSKQVSDTVASLKQQLDKVDFTKFAKLTDLANYYTKADTYNRTELDQKIDNAGKVKTVDGNSPDSNGNVVSKAVIYCDSPQAAYDASTKDKFHLYAYDMNNEATEGYVAGQRVTIETLHNDIQTLQSQMSSKANTSDLANLGKVKTVNGNSPDSNGNVNVPAPDLSGYATKSDLATAGKMKTISVNGGAKVAPDANGNADITVATVDISGKADKTDVNNLQAMVTGLSTKVDSVVTKLSDGTLAKVAHFKASEEQKAVDWSKDDGKGGLPKIGIIDG